jgi:protein-L-isoaspartate(D-aspartate) O-methyltransferase
MTDFTLARRNMVDGQLRPNRVTNSQLLAAIGALPREKFLPEGLSSVAYSDEDVPLGNGRFLMEPMVLARLIQTLQPRETDRALVVASGRGYGAALMARLVKSVVAVESDAVLAAAARSTARELGLGNIEQTVGPLEAGAAAAGPYDVILIEGAVRQVPPAILEQLVDGGRMGTIVAGPPGALGSARLFVKVGGVASGRPLFDAGTPALPGFAPPPRFTF